MQRSGIPHPQTGVQDLEVVTLSIGAATRVPTVNQTANMLIQAADDALYQAKQNGRNRVVSAADPVSGTTG